MSLSNVDFSAAGLNVDKGHIFNAIDEKRRHLPAGNIKAHKQFEKKQKQLNKSVQKFTKQRTAVWSKIQAWKSDKQGQATAVDFTAFTAAEKKQAHKQKRKLEIAQDIMRVFSMLFASTAAVGSILSLLGSIPPITPVLLPIGIGIAAVSFAALGALSLARLFMRNTKIERHLRVVEDKDFHAFVKKACQNRNFNPTMEDLHDKKLHKIYLDAKKRSNAFQSKVSTLVK